MLERQVEPSIPTDDETIGTTRDFTLLARIVGADDHTFVRVKFREGLTLGELRHEVAKHTPYRPSQIQIEFAGCHSNLSQGDDNVPLRELGKYVTAEGIEVGGEILCNIPLLIS